MNTWIDIVDTAVKVGLGALISGITTYYLTRLRYTHDRKKYLSENKLVVLREIVDSKQLCANLLNDFSHSSTSIRFPEDIEIIRTESSKIMDAHKKNNQALGLSYMIGLPKLRSKIDEYGEALLEFYYFMSKITEETDIGLADEMLKKLNGTGEEMHEEISRSYIELSQ